MSTNFDFTLNGENLDVIDPYIYLRITFKWFVCGQEETCRACSKVTFCHSQKIRNQNIPIDLQQKWFDSLVELIILYGSEVLGF